MKHCILILALIVPILAFSRDAAASGLPSANPAEVGLDAGRWARLHAVVLENIARGRLPGAVVLVVRQGKIAYRKAYGTRSKQPVETPMTVETVFDLASLTK